MSVEAAEPRPWEAGTGDDPTGSTTNEPNASSPQVLPVPAMASSRVSEPGYADGATPPLPMPGLVGPTNSVAPVSVAPVSAAPVSVVPVATNPVPVRASDTQGAAGPQDVPDRHSPASEGKAVATEPATSDDISVKNLAGLVGTILFTLLAVGVVAAMLGSTSGLYRFDVILSGSMKPTYQPGDLIYATHKPTNTINTGDVLMFRTPAEYGDEQVTHRVTQASIGEDGTVTVRTKGDNNEDVDPWQANLSTDEVWVVQKSIPKVGFVSAWAKQWWPALLAAFVAFPMYGFAFRRRRDARQATPTTTPSTAVDVDDDQEVAA